MQVKKFEAPTIQEALEHIKRELGPEAIILQTKKNKRGFGLMSKSSVEVTAAVSERALQKKSVVDSKLPEPNREKLKKMSADQQAEVYDKYERRQAGRTGGAVAAGPVTNKAARAANQAYGAQSRGASWSEADQADSQSSHLAGAVQGMKDQVQLGAGIKSKVAAAAAASAQWIGGKTSSATSSPKKPAPITERRYAEIPDDGEALAAPRLGAAAQMAVSGMPVEEELRHLKRMIEELKVAQDDGAVNSGAQALMPSGTLGTPALQDAYEQLILNGMDKRFALPLCKKVAFELGPEDSKDPERVLDQVAAELMEGTEVLSPFSRAQAGGSAPMVIAFVGPTGVGKTTTVAKVASEALLRRGLKVGLINLDSYKVAAFDQLATYAKILNVPFRSAGSAEDLKAAISEFQSLDLVLVDTTGRSQRDPQSLKSMQSILGEIPGIQSHLVLSVTTRDNELYDMANRFAAFRPQGLIMSKLDEATIYGSLYNVSQKVKLPLLYFTTGQRVPEDLEEASPERVAALILDL